MPNWQINYFVMKTWYRQDCLLSPVCFSMYSDMVMHNSEDEQQLNKWQRDVQLTLCWRHRVHGYFDSGCIRVSGKPIVVYNLYIEDEKIKVITATMNDGIMNRGTVWLWNKYDEVRVSKDTDCTREIHNRMGTSRPVGSSLVTKWRPGWLCG